MVQGATKSLLLGLAIAAAPALGCSRDSAGDGGADSSACQGAKCDEPGSTSYWWDTDTDGWGTDTDSDTDTDGDELDPQEVDALCNMRRGDAFNPNRQSFNENFLRWSCADVDGVATDERGQEYCEYFAIARIPNSDGFGDPLILGKNLGPDPEDGQTELAIELTDDERYWLEVEPDAIAGQCVFTSWNADIDQPDKDCQGKCLPGEVLGVPVDADTFRMTFDPNTNEAAVVLVEDCMNFIGTPGTEGNPDDPFHDDFYRGCWINAEVNDTYRKSDTVICAATMRLAECGCRIVGGAEPGAALAPSNTLGFPLGTWSDPSELPSGCRYEEVVDGAQQVVVCDLTAHEVLQNAGELKAYCQSEYADNVVVHIPIDPTAIVCEPNEEEEVYASTCTETPWVVTP